MHIKIVRIKNKGSDLIQVYDFLGGLVILRVCHAMNYAAEYELTLLGFLRLELDIMSRSDRAHELRMMREQEMINRLVRMSGEEFLLRVMKWPVEKVGNMMILYPAFRLRAQEMLKEVACPKI